MHRTAIILALMLPTLALADDLQTIHDRYVDSIIPHADAEQKAIVELGQKHAKSEQADGSWADIDYKNQAATNWVTARHFQRTREMAKAVHISHDETLKRKSLTALSYWLDHDFRNPNWWWNEIGVPDMIGPIGVLLEDDLSQQQRAGAIEIMKRSKREKWTGQNLVWGAEIEIVRGCLEHSSETIADGLNAIYSVLRIAGDGEEGIQSDFSFHQHGAQLYSGGYGRDFAYTVPRFVALAWGTQFQVSEDSMKVLTGYLLDGEQWMIRGRTFDYSAIGREIVRPGIGLIGTYSPTGVAAAPGHAYAAHYGIQTLARLSVPRQPEFAAFAARFSAAETTPLVGNRHFWRSDYMSHRRAGYFASVRMFSTRLRNSEVINREGRKSQHLADGVNYLYLTGDEYRDIFPVWDWTKIPGTTAEQNTLDIEGPPAIGVKGKTTFVGGVSDGTYGLAAMDMSRGKLTAHKTWIFFDDEYICLGAGITCTSENPVATTVNQCLLNGRVAQGANWVHHDSVGYVFPGKTTFQLAAKPQSGAWSEIGTGSDALVTRDVFTLHLDHGSHCRDATYQYTVLPGTTAQVTEARAAAPDVQIVSNTAQLAAAFHPALQMFAAAFWEPGRATYGDGHTVEVDRPCLLLVRRDSDGLRVSVSNPVNEPLTVQLTLEGRRQQIELPAGPAAGSSVTKLVRE